MNWLLAVFSGIQATAALIEIACRILKTKDKAMGERDGTEQIQQKDDSALREIERPLAASSHQRNL